MAANKGVEDSLNDVFVKNAPFQLPDGFKKFLVDVAPWASLIVGILYVLWAWSVFNWARVANAYVDLANQLSTYYGGSAITASRWTIWIYATLALAVVMAVLYLMAFPKLKVRSKSGWNLLYYAVWINVGYGLVSLFSDYGSGIGNFIFSLVGTAIGLYFLFQIRSSYSMSGGKKPNTTPTVNK
jgi:hypothetical protein